MSILLKSLFILSVFFIVSCSNSLQNADIVVSDGDDETVTDTDETVTDADETDDSDVPEEPLFNLKVEENKQNSLSCRLTFSTADERKTFVKYYSSGHAGYKITEESAEKEHYFFLWGMRENRDYKIEIYDEKSGELLATD